jgi:hydrogenase/urease accessory protein HupE
MRTNRHCALVVARLMTLLTFVSGLSYNISFAHEVRPAYLELTEEAPDTFGILFKTPMLGDLRLALTVGFSRPVEPLSPVLSRRTDDAIVQTWRVRALHGITGNQIRVIGLENTLSDALLRITFANGRSFVQRLTPAAPKVTIPVPATSSGVAATYLELGVEHILTGLDHLLFVLGLLLLTTSRRQLVVAVTAFTVAHSITLAAATLGVVHVPSRPIEAVIALSIVFVALEIVHAREGKLGIAARAPWIVAFGFGLLHGFGFAGALSETGLPDGHIAIALLFFNLGVEAGQLLFIGVVLAIWAFLRRLAFALPTWAPLIPPYLIGSLAMFWVIQRVASF